MAQPPRRQEAQEELDGVHIIVRKALYKVLGPEEEKLGDFTNVLKYGPDSLQVLQLLKLLNRSGLTCTTIKNFVEVISSKEDSSKMSPSPLSHEERMSAMFHRYSHFEAKPLNCVLVIGSAGGLGTHLLHQLMLDTDANGNHCINRSVDAPHR